MSPPQVNLAEKKAPVVSEEEIPAEKKDNTGIPVYVTVDTERNRRHRAAHQQRRKRNCRICIAVAAIVVIGVVLVTVGVCLKLRYRHHRKHHGDNDSFEKHGDFDNSWDKDHGFINRRRWTCLYGQENLHENVWVDHTNQLIHARHGHGSNQEPAMHLLHEYGRRMIAYKNEDTNICYITKLDETFYDGYYRWQSYEHSRREPKALRVLTNRKIEVEVLQHVTDQHIFALCEVAQSFWAVEIDKKEITATMKIINV